MRALRVGELMTREVVSLNRDDNIHLAMSVLRLHRIRHLPVVDRAGDFVGLVTHRDLVAAQADVLARPPTSAEAFSVPVARIMKVGVWTVHPHTAVLEAARIMLDHKVGCLPVLEQKRLVGIITEADLLGCFIRVLERRREREDTDPGVF